MIQELRDIYDLEDLLDFAAELSRCDDKRDNKLAPKAMRIYLRFANRAGHAVSKSLAAKYLDITDETINSWLKGDLIKSQRISNSPKEYVNLESLLDLANIIKSERAKDPKFYPSLATIPREWTETQIAPRLKEQA